MRGLGQCMVRTGEEKAGYGAGSHPMFNKVYG